MVLRTDTSRKNKLSLSVSLSTHKIEGFSLFHLFGVTSGLFQVVLGFPSSPQPALTCYNLFQAVPFVTNDDLQNVLTWKFTKNEIYGRYSYKMRKVSLQNGKLFVLQNRASGITKQGRYYRIAQFLLQNERGEYSKVGQSLQRREG